MKYLAVWAALLLFLMPAMAAPIVGPAAMTFKTITATGTTGVVTLNSQSASITVVNLSASATVYFSAVAPATTSSAPILPGAAYSYYDANAALKTFSLITSTGSVSVGVFAH